MAGNGHPVTRRRFLALSAAAVGGATLAACGGGSGDGDGSGETLSVSEPSYLQPSYKEQLDALTEAFGKEHPGVTVRQVSPPFAQYRSQVLTQLEAGSPPDVIRIDDPQIQFYIERGWLLPLDEALSAAGLDPATFIDSTKDAQSGGSTYGVPRETNPRVFIYNTDLYAKAGVEVPTDLDSLRQVLRRTSDAATGQFGMGIATKEGDPTGLFIQLMPIVLGFGGNFFSGAEPTATDPKVIEALEFVRSLWVDGQIPRGLDAVSVNNLVTQGKIASIISGSFIILQAVAANPEVGGKLTTAPNPMPAEVTMRATAWWGVPAKAKNPDLAKQYIVRLLQPEQQRQQVELTGTLPARPGMVPDSFVAKYPWFESVVEVGYGGSAVSYFPQQLGRAGNDALTEIGNGILGMLYEDRPVETAMRDVQAKLEQLLA